MNEALVIVIAAVAVLIGVAALVAVVRRISKGRRGRQLGDVSVEWLSRQKVRARRDD